MGNPDRNADLVRKACHEPAVPVHMAVDHIKRTVLPHYRSEKRGILWEILRIGAIMDPSTERKDLLIEGRFNIAVDQEVKLEIAPVDVPHNMHQPRFYAPAAHSADHIQDFPPHGLKFGVNYLAFDRSRDSSSV